MVRIVPAGTPAEIDRMVVVVYGQPGVGKTALASTAHNPVVLDFENGVHRSNMSPARVHVERWGDIAKLSAEDLEGYQTVVVDTIASAQDLLIEHMSAQNPKITSQYGALTLKGYGEMGGAFVQWTKSLLALKKDIVILAHSDEQQRGDDTVERVDTRGALRDEGDPEARDADG